MDINLYKNIWETVSSGIVGNATYDGLKSVLGKVFDRLVSCKENNDEKKFKETLEIAFDTKPEMLEQIKKVLQQKTTTNTVSIQTGNIHAEGNVTIGNIING